MAPSSLAGQTLFMAPSCSCVTIESLYRITINDWSTTVIPLDRYQVKLQELRIEWEVSQPVQPVHHQNERREIEQLRHTLQERERELQQERREKEQVRTSLQQQLQKKDRLITDKDCCGSMAHNLEVFLIR